MKDFKDLTEEQQQPYFDKVYEMFNGLLYCDRSWSAWQYKTMSESDFIDITTNSDFVYEKAEEIYNFLKVQIRKEKIKNVLNN